MNQDFDRYLAEMKLKGQADNWPQSMWGRVDRWLFHVAVIVVGAFAIYLTAIQFALTYGH